MANQDVRVSALQSASTLSTNDLALATVVDELSETGYTSKKITEGAKASQYLEAFTFANLNTNAKTIVGAINEAATTGGSDEFIIHMTDTTITETAADIIDAFDNGSEIWLESQITGEMIKTRLPLLAYISDSSQLVLRFSGITYANNRYRYCDVQMLRSPEQIVGRQAINVTFAVIDDATTSASSVWSSQKTAGELADKAEIADTVVSTSSAWSSSRIVGLLPTDTATGAIASFEDGADDVPIADGVFNIDYDANGFTGMSIYQRGANLWDEQLENGQINANTGAKESTPANRARSVNYIPIKATASYYCFSKEGVNVYAFFYDANKNYIGYVANPIKNSSFTPKDLPNAKVGGDTFDNACFMLFRYDNQAFVVGDCSINYPATDTTYHPYTGASFPVDWTDEAGTIYGGTFDSVSGVLTSTKAADGSDLAEPVEYQLDPVPIPTLKGSNNIWTDTGDVSVNYRADVQKYIDKKIAAAVGGNRSLSLMKSAPVETEETKQEEQEGDEDVNR